MEPSIDIPWDGRAIGLLDLDAFFASVEQLDHPAWRGKPVIVGGSPERRGVVSTASYEARAYGIHSAMPSYQARRLCPDALWTKGHFARYRELSEHVMRLLRDETPLVEQVSIDEAFFDVSPGRYSRESPIEICRRIQRRVSALGITCSIGLGTSKTVAKVASERQKPRGLTVVLPGTERGFLAPLPVRALSGIGAAGEARLASLGIHTLGQLASQDPQRMGELLGVAGPRMVMRAAGREESAVRGPGGRERAKSVSAERTFARDLTTRDELRAAIDHVSARVGTRLRQKGRTGSLVTLKLKFDVHHTHTAQRQMAGPTDDEHVFGAIARGLLEGLWREGTGVRLVGVGVSDLDGAHASQLGLFEEDSATVASGRDLRALAVATDDIRRRFGSAAVAYGRDLRFRIDEPDDQPDDSSPAADGP
ncbi:MAG: DNA polymerase IV [Acidobacteriota bacterium]|nr:DNA polymerase IV [Acidobacteriota bacterium]